VKATARHGTQTIERAVLVVRQLAARGSFGWRMSDLARTCKLDRATTHRIVACLMRERLASQRKSDRRYVPGPFLFELGLSISPLHAFQVASQAPLARIARRAGGIGLLYLRSGSEFVCAAREGTVDLKALTIEVGTRRPLIVSAGGLAILIALPRDERRRIVAENLESLDRFDEPRIRALRQVLRLSQERGYGVSEGHIVPGIAAYGVPIRDREGRPFASLSVVGLAQSSGRSSPGNLVGALEEEAHATEREAYRLLFSM
jgi:DNA-binding IclR family transcriptional regulator